MKRFILSLFLISIITLQAKATFNETLYYTQLEAHQNDGIYVGGSEFYDTTKYHRVLTEKTPTGKTVRYFDHDYNFVKEEQYNKKGKLLCIFNKEFSQPDSEDIKYVKIKVYNPANQVIKSAEGTGDNLKFYNNINSEITEEAWEKIQPGEYCHF